MYLQLGLIIFEFYGRIVQSSWKKNSIISENEDKFIKECS